MNKKQVLKSLHIIQEVESKVVFVGGVSLYLYGLKDTFTDIDVIVPSLINIQKLGTPIEYVTDSGFSFSGKRAFLIWEEKYKLDIFVENPVYQVELVEGLRCQSIGGMLKYYEDIQTRAKPIWDSYIEEKVEFLKKHI